MANTIYLVRHGENPANLTNEFSHKLVDYSLTAKGIKQAQLTATYFKDKHIHEVYSSPLKRARETAEIIAKEFGLPVGVLEQFREINVGDLERLPPSKENWGQHDRILQAWIAGRHETRFPGGEDYTMLLARMRSGLEQITRDKMGRNIVVVCHTGIFTSTIRAICPEMNPELIKRVRNRNCAITEIELSTENDRVVGTLKHWAYAAHLDDAELVSGNPSSSAGERKI